MDLQLLFISPGPLELAIVFMALVLLFGADKIPKVARSAGEALETFREGKKQAKDEIVQEYNGDSDNLDREKTTENN